VRSLGTACKLPLSDDKSLGIIACGIAYNYVMENIGEDKDFYSIMKISQYPIPKEKIKELYKHCDKILVVEEGYPIIEELLHDYFDESGKIKGKLSGDLPLTGELNPNTVGQATGFFQKTTSSIPEIVHGRPPQLCDGCGHTDMFNAINELIPEIGNKNVFGDIGCYALGALPPLNSINTLIDMGASITMAKGAADAGLKNAIAIIGDSTFTHSGMTGLIDAVNEKAPITVLISDNFTTGMTGGQDSAALGKIEDICEGLGVDPDHIIVFTPLKKNHDMMVDIIIKELEYDGVSVIIPRRQCVQTTRNAALNERIRELNLI
jgi:indolepyruvate ferredoxin oxidoreductase alpha subunit